MLSSRLEKFYSRTPKQRLEIIRKKSGLGSPQSRLIGGKKPFLSSMNDLAENVIGTFPLPYSVVPNFIINKRELLIPFACAEPGVVAGASIAAKLCRPAGGFTATSDEPIMIGHILIAKTPNPKKAVRKILANKGTLLRLARKYAKESKSTLKPIGLDCKSFKTSRGTMIGVYLDVNVGNATGPRSVARLCEKLTPDFEALTGGTVRMALHSDFAVKRLAHAKAVWRKEDLRFSNDFSGKDVIEGILDLMAYAQKDVFRACTNNKGVMNGIQAIAIATNNDAPLLEAGAHTFASKNGSYQPLTKYSVNKEGNLVGEITIPITMGVSGGVSKHPFAKISHQIMGIHSSRELAQVAASVGLAQNFAALRAMVTQSMEKGNQKIAASKN